MKVKNIMFSGFMAAILMSATGAADAAISVASKAYVDAKSGAVTTALNEYKTANDAKVDKNAEDIAQNAGSISMVSGALETLTGVVGTKAATTYVDAELAKKVDLTVYNEKMTALGNTDTSLQSQIDAVKALTGETGVAEQIASAVSVEKEAREAADQGLANDIAAINNAETGILKQAQTYADQAKAAAISTAAADATSKANQALTDAKDYTDALANGAVKANADAIAALNDTYVSESEMSEFETANTAAIADAKQAGTDAQADLNAYKTSNNAAVADAKKAGDDAQADLNAYKTSNNAAVATAKKAGDDAQADLNAYKTTNDAAVTAAAQAAADAAAAAAQALDDAKTYADGKDAETLASAKTYADQAEADAISTAAADATSKANAAQAAAEQTAANALSAAKSEIETELATKITAPEACKTQDCVLSINKASGTISWTPLTEPVDDYLN